MPDPIQSGETWGQTVTKLNELLSSVATVDEAADRAEAAQAAAELAADQTAASAADAGASAATAVAIAGTIIGAGSGRFHDGSAGAPAVTFASDTDTGLYRIAANILGVSAGGGERVRFTTAGMQVTGLLSGTAVTQSPTDVTAGRLLKVGDYGLGAPSGLFTTDVDTITVNGFYRLSTGAFSTASPTPGLGAGHYLIHYNWDANAAHQVLYTIGAARPSSFERTKLGGVWTAWRQVFNAGNIVGTVGQSGGVPTGRVIERGSNANGEFVRFADGTQICTRITSVANVSTALGALFRSDDVAWTFPAVFSAAPFVTASVDSPECWGMTSGAPSTLTVNLRALAAVSKAASQVVRAVAIGRWF